MAIFKSFTGGITMIDDFWTGFGEKQDFLKAFTL